MVSKNKYNNTKTKNYIPADWAHVSLAEFGDTYPGLFGKNKDDFGTGKPYIPYLNIFNNTIIRDGEFDYVNINLNENQSKVEKGDIFFTTSSETPEEVGMCSVYNGDEKELYLNSFCFGFRLFENNKISPVYLAHYFRGSIGRKIIYRLAQGATRYNLSKKTLLNEKFYLPTYPEQIKIEKILNIWDNAIEYSQKLILLKEKREKALMQRLLTGEKRLKGFKNNWKEYKMHNIFDRVTRKNSENNKNIITISAQRGFVRQDDFFNKTVASESLLNYFLVEKGEFCYNKSYSNGYPWGAVKILKDFDKAVVTTLYICFRLKDKSKSSTEFFEHYFEAGLLDKGLTKIAHEGGRAHGLLNVTPSDFFNLSINIPDKDEQIAIAKVINSADKEIELLKLKLEALKQQKKGLMQVLLTGKIRVKT